MLILYHDQKVLIKLLKHYQESKAKHYEYFNFFMDQLSQQCQQIANEVSQQTRHVQLDADGLQINQKIFNSDFKQNNPRDIIIQNYNIPNNICEQPDIQQQNNLFNLTKAVKVRLAHKITEIFYRKNADILHRGKQFISVNQKVSYSLDQQQNFKLSQKNIQLLQQYFQEYSNQIRNALQNHHAFAAIAKKASLPVEQVRKLYQEYSTDHLLGGRVASPTVHPSEPIRHERIQFLRSLLLKRGANESHGEGEGKEKPKWKWPFTRTAEEEVARTGSFIPKQAPQVQRNNINSECAIRNRYIYARRYIEISEERTADIYFLGEYSFCNNFSLSSCPASKRDSFTNYQVPTFPRRVKVAKEECEGGEAAGRNLQIMVAVSLQGVVHYEVFSRIFSQCHFSSVLEKIGKHIISRSSHLRKYLVLENNPFHCIQALKSFESQSEIKVVFLPAQTPMLNPTEFLFNELRQLVKSKTAKNYRAFSDIVREMLQSHRDRSMLCYYSCIRPYLELALGHQPFK